MPLDHMTHCLPNDTFEQSLAIYLAALEPLGYEKKMQFGPYVVGLGQKVSKLEEYGHADFWLKGQPESTNGTCHHAFLAAIDRPVRTRSRASFTQQATVRRIEHFGREFLALGIVAPPAAQRASLEENRRGDPGPVVYGEPHDIEYDCARGIG